MSEVEEKQTGGGRSESFGGCGLGEELERDSFHGPNEMETAA